MKQVLTLDGLRDAWIAGRTERFLQTDGVPGLVRVSLREVRVDRRDGTRVTFSHPERLEPTGDHGGDFRRGSIGRIVFALEVTKTSRPTLIVDVAPPDFIGVDSTDPELHALARAYLAAHGLLQSDALPAPRPERGLAAFLRLFEDVGEARVPARLFQEELGADVLEALTARAIIRSPGAADASISSRAFEDALAALFELQAVQLRAPVHGPLKKIGEERGRGGARDVFLCHRPWDGALGAALALRERAHHRTLVLCPTGRHVPADLPAIYGAGGRVELALLDDLLEVKRRALALAAPLAPLSTRLQREGKRPAFGLVLPKPSSWGELEVYLIDEHTVLLVVGAHEQLVTYADLRMAHARTRAPTWSFKILVITCKQAGRFSLDDDEARVKTRLVHFRKAFRGLFGLEDDPFEVYRAGLGGWRAKFRAFPSGRASFPRADRLPKR